MNKARERMYQSNNFQEQQKEIKLIWSRIVAEPMTSPHFLEKTLFNSLKTINSETAALLFDEGFGNVKHSRIDPTPKMFDTEGMPTLEACLRFLEELKIKETQKKRDKLTEHIKELKGIVKSIQKAGQSDSCTPKVNQNK